MCDLLYFSSLFFQLNESREELLRTPHSKAINNSGKLWEKDELMSKMEIGQEDLSPNPFIINPQKK